jgi:hypothetical protein
MSGRLVGPIAGVLLVVCPACAPAQADASLGLGFGTVRFPGGSTLGVVSLGPALQLLGPGRSLEADGTLAQLPSGNGYVQGRLALWVATPPLDDRWRLAVDAQLSGAASGHSAGSGAGQLGAEALFAAPRWGIAVATGPASGWILHALPVTAWRARVRGWWQTVPARTALFASIEPTRFLGSWYTDLAGGVILHTGRVEARLSTAARVSRVYGSRGAGLAAVDLRLAPGVSLEASGGNVLPDPYQGLPASGFVSIGVRVHLPSHRAAPTSLVRSRSLTAFRRGDGIVIRLRLRDAHRVAIAGDWNEWTPTPLAQSDPDQWELLIALSAGPHRFVVFIDGAPWRIPDGVPSVPDGMGGRVAVLNVF